jgi:hypothetical protein
LHSVLEQLLQCHVRTDSSGDATGRRWGRLSILTRDTVLDFIRGLHGL